MWVQPCDPCVSEAFGDKRSVSSIYFWSYSVTCVDNGQIARRAVLAIATVILFFGKDSFYERALFVVSLRLERLL